MSNAPFPYLYIHTHFSLDGGPTSPEEWCRAAAQLGYTTAGIADRGPLMGLPAFSRAARAAGITPVYGMEVDLGGAAEPATVVLYARNRIGLSNLFRLSSLAYSNWPQQSEALPWDDLVANNDGLAVVLVSDAQRTGDKLKELFGDAVFAAVTESSEIGKGIAVSLPPIAMPAARYITPDYTPAYNALRLLRRRTGWDITREHASGQHLQAPYRIAEIYAQMPLALENAARLAELCSGVGYLDDLLQEPLPPDAIEVGKVRLGAAAEASFRARLNTDKLPADVTERLQAELDAFAKSGTLPSWLGLLEVAEQAQGDKARGIAPVPLGAPLGSACDSLVAYALGIAPLNPLSYPAPAWLGENRQASTPPGVELPEKTRMAVVSTLSRMHGARPAFVHALCTAPVGPAEAAWAAATTLNLGPDEVRRCTEEAAAGGWVVLTNDGTSGISELALQLRGAPARFNADPDTLVAFAPNALPLLANGATAWDAPSLTQTGAATLTLQPTHSLDTLARAAEIALRYPAPDLTLPENGFAEFPALSPKAGKIISHAEFAGVPYLTSTVVKGWKGEVTASTLIAALGKALTTIQATTAPKLDIWNDATSDTGGALLYRDQWAKLLMSLAGMESHTSEQLRKTLLMGSEEAKAEALGRLAAACAELGADEEAAEALRQCLVASAPGLLRRQTVAAYVRVAMWSAQLKAAHPAALVAAMLNGAAEAGKDVVTVRRLAEEATQMRVALLPPDASHSRPLCTLELEGAAWAVRWGLALLPGWDLSTATRFVEARPKAGFDGPAALATAAVKAQLSSEQGSTLVSSGACDRLGGKARSREALIVELPAWIRWAEAGKSEATQRNSLPVAQLDLFAAPADVPPKSPDELATLAVEPLSPRRRYLWRLWEAEQLGRGFTGSPEFDQLKRALDHSGRMPARLLTSTQLSSEQVGQSVCIIGLLTQISMVEQAGGESAESKGRSASGTNGKPAAKGADTIATAIVEDMSGEVEMVAFPQSYRRHAKLWTEHNLVIITGRVSRHDEGEFYLLCEHMAPFFPEIEEPVVDIKVKASKKVIIPPADIEVGKGDIGKAESPVTESAAAAYPPAFQAAGNHNSAHTNVTIQTSIPIQTPTPAVAGVGAGGGSSTHPMSSTDIPSTNGRSGPPAYHITIVLSATDDEGADIDRMISLKQILNEHAGSDAVTLKIPYSPATGHVTSATLPRGVRYNPVLEAQVISLLGPQAMAVTRL